MEWQALFKEADVKEGVVSPDILFSTDSSRVKSQFFMCLAVIFLTLAPNKLQFPLASRTVGIMTFIKACGTDAKAPGLHGGNHVKNQCVK